MRLVPGPSAVIAPRSNRESREIFQAAIVLGVIHQILDGVIRSRENQAIALLQLGDDISGYVEDVFADRVLHERLRARVPGVVKSQGQRQKSRRAGVCGVITVSRS